MKILRNYILKELAGPFLISLAVFTFVMVVGNIVKMADMIINFDGERFIPDAAENLIKPNGNNWALNSGATAIILAGGKSRRMGWGRCLSIFRTASRGLLLLLRHRTPGRSLPHRYRLVAGVVAANFIVVTATARPWIYYLVIANTGGAVVTVTLAEPGGNTLIVEVPANDTRVLASVPTAPIFVSRTAGQITLVADIAAVAQVTATYTNK